MRLVLTILIGLLALAYAFALAVFAVGTFGWFGVTPSALAGVYLIPIGWPWNLALHNVSETFRPWLGLLAPLLNIVLLWLLRRTLKR